MKWRIGKMGKNKPADEQKANDVTVKDDIGEQILEEQRKAIERELEQFEKQLTQHEANKKNFAEQWEVDNELYQIMIANHKKLPEHCIFEYEKDDKYWELRKRQLEYKYRMDKFMSEAKMREFDRAAEACQEEIDSAKKKLDELLGDKDGE